VTEIVLNAAELAVTRASLRRDDQVLVGSVQVEEETERATIALDGVAAPGRWTLELAFSGVLNDKLVGFYRSAYTDEEGNRHVIATTQFEATDARRAFPCWDEPDRKAVFSVTLVVDRGMTAISNSPVARVEQFDGAKDRVTFADTIVMSTYLVAFVVGPLELTDPVDVDGVPLRAAVVPGKRHLARFALDVGAHALRFFGGYFGIPYPAAKLDLIALPDFAFGAMENLGAVTFRETTLLVDAQVASRLELERVADVVAHEIAHMWFGDLVTMRWWNGIWLNEAFATFMEVLAVDAFRPEWERWVSFGTGRASALFTDGLRATRPVEYPVRRPEDAEGMFDVLTYQKGASVVRMLEQYLGPEEFRAGIRHYMAMHAYGNTETTDLWDAIEEATGEPVRSIMDSWIFQDGYPVLEVETTGTSTLSISQQRFRYLPPREDGRTRWHVPVLLRARVDGTTQSRKLVLSGDATTVAFEGRVDRLVVNAGGAGFYRTRYSPQLMARLTDDRDELNAIERVNLVADTWASALAGFAPAEEFLRLIRIFGDESDPTVWNVTLGPLGLAERVLRPEERDRLQAFVGRLAGPAFARLGWQRAEGEAEKTATLRATLLGALGGMGEDRAVQRRAVDLHAAYLRDRTAVDPDLVAPIVAIVARRGGELEYETFLERYHAPATPQEKVRYLFALAGFRDPGLLLRTLELSVSDDVRRQDGPYLVNAALGNIVGGELAWAWVKEHWPALTERFPDNSHPRMLENVSTLVRRELAADARAFLESHPVKAGQRTVEQTLERLDVNVAFGEREGARLASVLSES
jgi:puromycin-sensitive aminopeptidase